MNPVITCWFSTQSLTMRILASKIPPPKPGTQGERHRGALLVILDLPVLALPHQRTVARSRRERAARNKAGFVCPGRQPAVTWKAAKWAPDILWFINVYHRLTMMNG